MKGFVEYQCQYLFGFDGMKNMLYKCSKLKNIFLKNYKKTPTRFHLFLYFFREILLNVYVILVNFQ